MDKPVFGRTASIELTDIYSYSVMGGFPDPPAKLKGGLCVE
jgi:hypothetical protein